MRIGKLQINWNPPRPKIDRQLSLEKFYTFKTGEVIYTYKVEDLARISGRYLDEVKNTLNFMLKYAAGPKQVKAFADNVSAKLLSAIEEPHPQKRLDHIIEAREIAKRLPKLQDYVEDIHLKHWHDLYVMFFVLDGEDECYFSKKWNDKKIELLKAEGDEAAEVFFSFLEALMINFSTTYRSDMISSMVREKEVMEMAASLTTLTSRLNMKYTSANGQESELKSTGI